MNLARAFYSGRPYLVLDDTLSAVDSRTEAALMERLEKFVGGFVLVTHRTAELMRVEEILVFSQGDVVEKGSPVQLASKSDSHFAKVLKAYERNPGEQLH